jgi:hypothetical protein
MTYDQLIKHYGSLSGVTKATGIVRQTVHYWKRGGIPEHRQRYFQRVTNGKLKVDSDLAAEYREMSRAA